MQMISMKQFRESFDKIKQGLKRGQEYILLYRSKPLAKIVPYKDQFKKETMSQKITTHYDKQPQPVELKLADALLPAAYQYVKQAQPIHLMQEDQVWAEITPKKVDLWAGKSMEEKLAYVRETAGIFKGKSLTPAEMNKMYDEEVYGELLS